MRAKGMAYLALGLMGAGAIAGYTTALMGGADPAEKMLLVPTGCTIAIFFIALVT